VTIEDTLSLSSGPSRRVTAVELVRDTLRTAILRGDLLGGTQLVQTEIASRLGVSTTPVREAMRDLVSEGLIVMDSHKIGMVRKPDWDEMSEIVEVRRALEPAAIRLAMENLTPATLAEARALADSLAGEEDLGNWVQENIRFHSVFHRATETVKLSGILISLEEASGVYVAQAQRLHPEIRKRAIADHYALLEAYEEKDFDRALDIQLGHLELPLQAAEPEA
jgi:DNA-binding GntR family transcriptional regulator